MLCLRVGGLSNEFCHGVDQDVGSFPLCCPVRVHLQLFSPLLKIWVHIKVCCV